MSYENKSAAKYSGRSEECRVSSGSEPLPETPIWLSALVHLRLICRMAMKEGSPPARRATVRAPGASSGPTCPLYLRRVAFFLRLDRSFLPAERRLLTRNWRTGRVKVLTDSDAIGGDTEMHGR